MKWVECIKLQSGQVSDLDDTGLFCTCRQPREGRFMIQCDYCREWFHGACVNVSVTGALGMEKYRCPVCIRKDQRVVCPYSWTRGFLAHSSCGLPEGFYPTRGHAYVRRWSAR